jgi:hypothetical protein
VLSFQMTNSGKTIQIDCDEQGLRVLLDVLAKVRAHGSHMHLCTPSNGGHELSETTPFGEAAIGEVVVSYVQE